LLDGAPSAAAGRRPAAATPAGTRLSVVGPQPVTIHCARVFVLPNPSGRNANFTYPEMLEAFLRLRRWTEQVRRGYCG